MNRFCLACLLVLASSCASQPQGQQEEPVSETRLPLNGLRHQQTTRAGVSAWVDATATDSFVAVSTIGDSDPLTNPKSETHFDNCYWNEGRDWILLKRGDAVAAALKFHQSSDAADRQAFFNAFGYVLHAAEDFYSHSNWVETHEPGILANFSDPGVTAPAGWYSGTYDNSGDTGPNAGAAHCPALTPPHSLLNKDGAAGPLKDEAFLDATLAVTLELQKLIAAIRAAAPADADAILSSLGFLSPEPARTDSRPGDAETLTLAPAGKGLFTPALFCKPGTFANGFQQRVEENQGSGDDSTLNAVALMCADRDGNFVERLSAWQGVWGTWSTVASCPAKQLVTRGQLKVETPQLTGDDTAANAARFACDDSSQLNASNDGAWGDWGAEAACAQGEAVCGVEIAYQAPQDGSDDLGMTGMKVHCCLLEEPDGGFGGSAGAGGADAGGSGGEAGGDSGTAGAAGDAGHAGAAGSSAGSAGSSAGGSAGSKQDAGTGGGQAAESEAPLADEGGCSCGAAGASRSPSGLLALALLALVRRGRVVTRR